MNINISLIKKIDNIVKLSNEFDNIFNSIIKISDNTNINSEQIENLYKLTQLFIFIRSEHGGLLILFDRKKKKMNSETSELSDKLVNDLYDLSTFYSILQNISELVSNIDFEFKRIAIMFPKFMNKKPMTLILFIDDINTKNKHVDLIEEVKKLNPENIYKIFECKVGQKINCGKVLNKNVNITVENIPSLFLINESNINDMQLDKIENASELSKMLS